MTTETHLPNCPNAKPAEPKPCHICGQEQSKHIGAYRACPVPAEPTACRCGAAVGHVCHAAECVPVCAYHSPTCPARKAAEPQGSEGSEPPIDWPEAEKVFCQMQSGYTYIGKGPEGYLQNAARAYLALKAERDALRDRLTTAEKCVSAAKSVIDGMEREIGGAHVDIIQKVAENAALKARVEELEGAIVDATQRANYSAWIVLDDMANAIRARKEASNGK